MTRTIESPVGPVRLIPVMAHVPPDGSRQDEEPVERESSPLVDVTGGRERVERQGAPAAA
jgi:hypothetical protein